MRAEPASRLSRSLGTGDAVVIGLGAMIGAGIFAAIGPAAEAAGSGLLVGLAVAAVVAYCNATSSAQLAALYPASGGTYVYGRERLGPMWGFLAGWGFVVGKTASCAAMALTFGAYAAPSAARPLAIVAVVALTTVNLFGVRKTAHLTRVILAVVLLSLAAVIVATLGGGSATPANLGPVGAGGVTGILQSAGLLFFAFAGYARIATLGEEVRDPARTIPRAIPLALAIALVVYASVAAAALLAAAPAALAAAAAPLEAAVRAGSLDGLVPAVRIGGSVAALGVLLSLTVGVSRTAFAMAADGNLPRWLDAVHLEHRVPHHAELAVGAVVVAVVLAVDVRGAIGFSSFAVLAYYAIANASAWTLGPDDRRWPRWMAGLGVGGCAVLAVTLPRSSVLAGAAVLATGAAVRGRRPAAPVPFRAMAELTAAEIPVAHTPSGGYGDAMPRPILAACVDPLVTGAPDLRGMWVVVVVEVDGEEVRGHPLMGHRQRIEQAGDRLVVTAGGVVHDMRCDGTEEHGVHDVAERDYTTEITVVASYEDGVHVLRPVGLPGIEVTRQRDGDQLVWTYPGFTARLERLGPPE